MTLNSIHRVFVVGTPDHFYPTPDQIEALVMKCMCQRHPDDNVVHIASAPVLAVSCELFEEDFDFDFEDPELLELYEAAQKAVRRGTATILPDEAALRDAIAHGGCPTCASHPELKAPNEP
jgi:hypothetical protein